MVHAEVDAEVEDARAEEVVRLAGAEAGVEHGLGQELERGGGELAEVFLAEGAFAESGAFAGEELGADARAVGGGDRVALPNGAGGGPLGVKESALAAGGGDEPEGAVGRGKHGADGLVGGVGNEGGLVDDEKGDAGEAADGVGHGGQGDDGGAVFQAQGAPVARVAAECGRPGQAGNEVADLFQKEAALAFARGDAEDQGSRLETGMVEGAQGRDGGLAPLAGAAEQQVAGRGIEDAGLSGIGGEAEPIAGPIRDQGGRESVRQSDRPTAGAGVRAVEEGALFPHGKAAGARGRLSQILRAGAEREGRQLGKQLKRKGIQFCGARERVRPTPRNGTTRDEEAVRAMG